MCRITGLPTIDWIDSAADAVAATAASINVTNVGTVMTLFRALTLHDLRGNQSKLTRVQFASNLFSNHEIGRMTIDYVDPPLGFQATDLG
jgi:hypothetical protein